jgi:hypothetical protein
MSSWHLTVITMSMSHWSRLHYSWLLTQHKLIFINQQHMRVSFSSECSTFLVDVAYLKRYINISGIHWIPVGKVFYPYPTRCISGIRPDRTHGWDFVPVSISGGYETRGYPYPRVQLPSLRTWPDRFRPSPSTSRTSTWPPRLPGANPTLRRTSLAAGKPRRPVYFHGYCFKGGRDLGEKEEEVGGFLNSQRLIWIVPQGHKLKTWFRKSTGSRCKLVFHKTF